MTALTRQQLCAELQISESTVRRLELEGFPFTQAGNGSRGKRYDLAECKAWLRRRQCQPGSTKQRAGVTSASWSKADEFTALCRKAQLRVMPSS